MRSKLLAAAACAALSFAATAAMAQEGGAGDGVTTAGPAQFYAPAGKDSGARAKPFPKAVNQGPFNMKTWKYGPRSNPPADAKLLWNPAMIKLKAGGKLFSDTVDGHSTPEAYCTAAARDTNDFIWTEMQHSSGTWHDVRLMWTMCPHAHAVPGARIPNANEFDEQHATDMGALVLVIPTVRSIAEGKEGAKWAFFPPMGQRSAGTQLASQAAFWGGPDYAGRYYRQTINQNLVLIEMIETLDGIRDADQIAKIPGVSGLFAASSDLGNFSGYGQGDPDYERLINIVHDATLKAHIALCGPSSWATRPDFTCFQGGPPGAGRGGAGGAGRGGRGRGAAGAAAPGAPAAGGAPAAPAPALAQ